MTFTNPTTGRTSTAASKRLDNAKRLVPNGVMNWVTHFLSPQALLLVQTYALIAAGTQSMKPWEWSPLAWLTYMTLTVLFIAVGIWDMTKPRPAGFEPTRQ